MKTRILMFVVMFVMVSTTAFAGERFVKDLDLVAGGYVQVSSSGDRSDRSNSYDWYDGAVYFLEKSGKRFGVAGNFSEFRGESWDGFKYRGHTVSVGAALKQIGAGYDITLKGMFGQRHDEGERGSYQMTQNSKLVMASVYLNNYKRNDQRVLPRFSAGAWVERDVSHEKISTWNGRVISPADDPAEAKNGVGASLKVHLIGGKIRPVAVMETAKRGEWHSLIIGGGVSDRNQIIWADVRYDLLNETTGVAFQLDAGQLYRRSRNR